MTETSPGGSLSRPSGGLQATAAAPQPSTLADILERVLDKGIVIAGDIRVNLLEIELLTIKIRLLVASVDKAAEMGIDWWRHDPMLSGQQQDLAEENRRLRERVEALEASSRRDGQAADEPQPERQEEAREHG
jgi:hypothetical protein